MMSIRDVSLARPGRWRALGAAVALAGGLVAVSNAVPGARPAHADSTLAGGGEYHPVTPARIYDSRPATAIGEAAPGARALTVSPDSASKFDVAVLGVGGVPADATKVLAIAVSFTVSEATTSGYLKAYASGAAPSTSSIVNFDSSDAVPNLAFVSPGSNGKITIGMYGNAGNSAQVLVDVFGWFSTSSEPSGADNGARLIPRSPGRILDTRDGTNRPSKTPLGAREVLTLPIRGVDAVSPSQPAIVPNDPNVVGVMLNVTGITARPGGVATHLSLFPTDLGGADPTTSNVNLAAKTIKATVALVPIGADGKVRIFNNSGQTDVVVDVVGYLSKGADPATATGRVIPLSAPYRTFDTREAQWGKTPLPPASAENWSFADFAASVKINGASVGAQSAVIGNLTNASLTRQYATVPVGSFLTAWPGGTRPLSSNLNTVEGPPVANMAILTYGANNTEQFFNYAGNAHYVFDAAAVVLA